MQRKLHFRNIHMQTLSGRFVILRSKSRNLHVSAKNRKKVYHSFHALAVRKLRQVQNRWPLYMLYLQLNYIMNSIL